MQRWSAHLVIGAMVALGAACGGSGGSGGAREADGRTERERLPRVALAGHDLPQVVQRDTLVVLSPFNSTSYFIYRGEAMGFEYDLLRAFAASRGLALRVHVVYDPDSLFHLLESGAGDVVAGRLMIPPRTEWRVAFTKPLYETPPVVVQRDAPADGMPLPAAADTMIERPDDADEAAGLPDPTRPAPSAPAAARSPASIRARLVTRPSDLAGDTVHVPWGSPYRNMLVELADPSTGDVIVVETEDSTSHERLIEQVANGAIGFTVAPENVADLHESQFANIAVLPQVGPEQPVAWAVRANAPQLRSALDAWLAEPATRQQLATLYRRYFLDRRGFEERVASEYLTSHTGQLSRYDSLFKHFAREIDWDWRLLASQAYQESRFVATARSWAGAVGLLQLMPATAREVGVRNPRDPEDNVRGGVRYLQYLERYWSTIIPDRDERLRFVLASYNTGIGHVQDARRLTVKHGGDADDWNEVAYWLLQKSRREVYTDPVVKYGFSRGLEPVTYVALVLERFEHYRQFVVG